MIHDLGGDRTHDDLPARKISSVLRRLTAMTELRSPISSALPNNLPHARNDGEQGFGGSSPGMQHLPLDPIIIPYALGDRVHRFS